MTRPRFLPKYVTSFTDRHGHEWLRFRRKGFASYYFKSALGTEAFRAEYHACMNPGEVEPPAVQRATPGSLDELVARYFATPERLGPSVVTQGKVRAVVESFREGRGDRPVAAVTFEHLEAIIAKRRVKTGTGNKTKGGIEAARKLRKELVRLFDFAVKIGMRADNPARQTDAIRVPRGERSKGFHTWTEAEIAAYRARHTLGTKARLALELLLWTGSRRSDARLLGRQHIKGGRIRLDQNKTGKGGWVAVAPQLLEAIVAMPPNGALCFLVTDFGKPFTAPGFGNKFREWCDQAGLPQCSAHGLRKAIMRRMAEMGATNQQMKSVSLHSKDDEVARYTAEANQQAMADAAIGALAAWDRQAVSNPAETLDTEDAVNG